MIARYITYAALILLAFAASQALIYTALLNPRETLTLILIAIGITWAAHTVAGTP